MADLPTIPQFFAGRSILVTGASGFMGKVLVEKLLYSCPDVAAIYVVLRPKKGSNPSARLKEMMESLCFGRLDATAKAKVVALAGDISALGVGLSEANRLLLQERVSVVFHVAASVRFDDSLKKATLMNTRGTREMLELAKGMKDLQAFVHFSTAYCNIDHGAEIEERVYRSHADWRKTIEMAENLDETLLDVLAHKYMGNHPNTYTFTKSLAENVIEDNASEIPIAIIRPSIVISSAEEPFPGWLDTFNGPMSLVVGIEKGIIRVVMMNPETAQDYVPVDCVTRGFIVAAWEKAVLSKRSPKPSVYNGGSSAYQTPLCFKDMVKLALEANKITPLTDSIWKPSVILTQSWTVYYILLYLLQVLPALILDGALRLAGVAPMLTKVQRRVIVSNGALSYFTSHQWKFHEGNSRKMHTLIKPEDMEAFDYFKFIGVDYFEFLKLMQQGFVKFLLNEKEEGLPAARKHLQRMEILDTAVKGLMLLLFLWATVHFQLAHKCIDTFYDLISSLTSYGNSMVE